jgi:hypothetical protein
MTKTELFETMKTLWNEFETAHNGTTKKSQAEARKIINDFKKIVTDYRKASVEEGKNK